MAFLRRWRASAGDVGGVLAWVTCLRGWRASVGGVGGVLTWVACLGEWRASVRDMPAWVMWVVYVYVFTCVFFRFGVISQITN